MASNPKKQDSMVADRSGNPMLGEQQALVGASNTDVLTITYSAGPAPTPATAQTIADSAAPTVVELLQYCANLEDVLTKTRNVLIAHGLMAD